MSEEKEIRLTGQQVQEMFELERAKLNALMQRINEMQKAIMEIKASSEALKELRSQKNCKTLVPLGAGVFVEATIENAETVKATLPGNIVINQTMEKTLKGLEKQVEEIGKEIDALDKERQAAATNVNSLGNMLYNAQQQARKQQKV